MKLLSLILLAASLHAQDVATPLTQAQAAIGSAINANALRDTLNAKNAAIIAALPPEVLKEITDTIAAGGTVVGVLTVRPGETVDGAQRIRVAPVPVVMPKP